MEKCHDYMYFEKITMAVVEVTGKGSQWMWVYRKLL